MRWAKALPDSVVGRISGGRASRAVAGSASNHRSGGSSTWLSAEISGTVARSKAPPGRIASGILTHETIMIKREAGMRTRVKWRERSRERALEREKRKSDEQTSAFVGAARELAVESGGLDFTVQA